jgi:hypothetical protein
MLIDGPTNDLAQGRTGPFGLAFEPVVKLIWDEEVEVPHELFLMTISLSKNSSVRQDRSSKFSGLGPGPAFDATGPGWGYVSRTNRVIE